MPWLQIFGCAAPFNNILMTMAANIRVRCTISYILTPYLQNVSVLWRYWASEYLKKLPYYEGFHCYTRAETVGF
jgi:hypothetical protein